jgi:uncharacterized protein YkwD
MPTKQHKPYSERFSQRILSCKHYKAMTKYKINRRTLAKGCAVMGKKGKGFSFVLICFLFTIFSFVTVYGVGVSIDGEVIEFTDQAPALIDGRTLVPLRAVFEHIGFEVGWDEPTRAVTLERGDDFIGIAVGSSVFVSNGQFYMLDVPAQVIEGRTLLPIRAVLMSVGYSVGWEASTNTVLVSSESPSEPLAPIRYLTIPNRRLFDGEIAAWITLYEAFGGASEFEREVIRLTNIERVAAGQSILTEYAPLMMSARFKAKSLSHLDYWAHTSPVYGNFYNIIREVFGVTGRSLGENLGKGHPTPEDVVQGWMDSPDHRNNLLSPNHSYIGVGFYENHWAQHFSN